MIKKSLLLSMLIILLSGTAFMMYLIIERVAHRRLTRQNLEILGNFPIFNFDSTRIRLNSNRKSILVYFDSGCDHCLYELNQIFIHKNSFRDSDIVLMSSELISTIKIYAEKNCPVGLPNIHFAKINQSDAYNTFGSLAVPQIFIYGADGVLIKDFRGETKMEAVLQYLSRDV